MIIIHITGDQADCQNNFCAVKHWALPGGFKLLDNIRQLDAGFNAVTL